MTQAGSTPQDLGAHQGPSFTAVDFETANGFRGSPCAVGLVKVRNGREVDSFYTTMRPPEGFDRFDPRNVSIHGITEARARSAGRFADHFAAMMEFIGEDTLVAHNASFDIEVFEAALEVSGMDSPGLRCLCSVRLSRANYDLASHALPHAAAEAGFDLQHHHWALEDARAAAAVVVDISRRRGINDLHKLFRSNQIETEELEPWTGQRRYESRATRQVRAYAHLFDSRVPGIDPSSLPDLMRWQDEGRNPLPRADADAQHPLFGQQIVFTGNLAIPRPDAKQLAADHGALTSSRVTAGTTLLVIGDGYEHADLETAEPSPPLTARKAREALRRRAAGQNIQIFSEADFRQTLGSAWPQHLVPAALSAAR